jgi:hypothetical protein
MEPPDSITTQPQDGSKTVTRVQLTLVRKQEDVNTLSVSFFYELGKMGKSVDFQLKPLSIMSAVQLQALLCAKVANNVFTVIDVYPLNGTVKSRKFKITDFVRPNHRAEIKQHIEILNEISSHERHARCLVIDFKDCNKRYDLLAEIGAAENEFATFFKGDGSNKKDIQAEIYNLFKSCKIDFFINEGSLKANLLKKAFSPEQSDFFQKDEKGSQILCQLCEVIMNGFKQGCGVVVNGIQLNPDEYISFVNNFLEKEEEGRKEVKLPPIRLLTLYPNCYKETYSHKSTYFELITSIFRTSHENKNNTTIITIE